jgi:hypothetical protein
MAKVDFLQTFVGSNGSNITKASSGLGVSGNAFDFMILNSGTDITLNGDAAFVYSTAATIEGTSGARMFMTGITANTYYGWLIPTGTGKFTVMRYPWKAPSNPAATTIMSRIDTPSTFSQMKQNTAGKVTVSAGATDIVASTSTAALTPGSNYWIEHLLEAGTTTSNGTVGYRIITNSLANGQGSDTLVQEYVNTAQNTGTETDIGGATSRWRFYSPFANSGWTSFDTDLWRARITTVSRDWLGPYVSTTPPTGIATVGSAPVYPVTIVPSNGTPPYTYTVTQATGPAGQTYAYLGNNAFEFSVPDSAVATWNIDIKDSFNVSSTSPVVVTIPKSTLLPPPVLEYIKVGGVWV